VIDALDSVLLGGPGRRADYDAAVEAIDDPEKLAAFRAAWQEKRSSLNDIGGYAHGLARSMREQDMWENSRVWKGLPLTIDEVVGRYLRHIADGPNCASFLRDCDWPGDGSNAKGFDSWLAMWRWSHGRNESDGVKSEWDSRDYTDDEMRMIYDDIIQHASRDRGGDA
jgi:hypothetical protein